MNDAPDRPEFVEAPGANLAVQSWGDPNGHPVILMHGMPGSRLGPRPRGIVLERMGIWLLSYDRPGYGYSERKPGRRVADAAEDVRRIAEHFDLKSFAVVGRSGGGPHALACAALLPDLVERVAVLVSAAPPDASGLAWGEGMTSLNVDDYADVDRSMADAPADGYAAARNLIARAAGIKADPESMISFLLPALNDADKRVVTDRAMRNLLTETYLEAVRQGADGWIDDAVALRSNWEFKLDDVVCPVLLWHGLDDGFSPVGHTHWMAKQLRNAREPGPGQDQVHVRIEHGAAHFAAFEIFPEVLGWLVDPELPPAPTLVGERLTSSVGAGRGV